MTALRQAVVDTGRQRAHVVLVGGEAGIGKTRLLDEFEASLSSMPPAGRPVLVVRGTCSELAAGSLPFLPILDLLDGLAASDGAAGTVARLRADMAGSGGDPASPGTRSSAFLGFRNAVVGVADATDLVLVVDDLHWADRSTLELLTFVAPRLGEARVTLVGAYRSDELHRRHPLLPVLVELERAGSLAHLRLEPLEPDEVALQLEGITGASLPPTHLARIVELADGNPFYVEQLAVLDLEGTRLPASLRDVLAARLSRLSDRAIEVLSGAAVIGRDVDQELLRAIVELSPMDVAASLNDAVQLQVIEPTPDGRRYRFRHALLAEAVRDDLLPAERIGLHRRLAEALTARPQLGAESPAGAAAEVAHHWTEAGDGARALPAWIDAGRSAAAAHAWKESASAYERALLLAATGVGGLDAGERADLGMRAAMMTNFAGEPRRAYELAAAAMATDDGFAPAVSALRWADFAGLANDAGEFEEERRAADRSIELMPTDPPTPALALVLVGHVGSQMLRSAHRAAVAEADEALRVCRLVGARDGELQVLATRAQSLVNLGHPDAAASMADEILAGVAARESAVTWEIGSAVVNEMAALVYGGLFAAALDFDARLAPYVRDLDIERAWRPWLDGLAAHAEFYLGRWPEASTRVDLVARTEPVGFLAWGNTTERLLLDAARGTRSPGASADDPSAWSEPSMRSDQWVATALAALWVGDADAAIGPADAAVGSVVGTENVVSIAWAVAVATRAWADRAETARAARRDADLETAHRRADELAGIADSIAAGTYLDGASATPWMGALCAAAEAERLRAAGRSEPGAWQLVATAYEVLGARPSAAYARYRAGEALLDAGDRDGAAAVLGEAENVARELGAAPLRAMIEGLGRRGRLSLGNRPGAAEPSADARDASAEPLATVADPWGLSAREREVLALVAEGRTNRQIGEALFISAKTASVHVTHILVKLGVSSRTEAALLAARAGIDREDA